MIIPLPPTRARYLRLTSEASSTNWWTVQDLNLRNAPNPGPVEPAGPGLITDSAVFHGSTITGSYNAGSGPVVVPWPVDSFPYTYRLPATAAATFTVIDR